MLDLMGSAVEGGIDLGEGQSFYAHRGGCMCGPCMAGQEANANVFEGIFDAAGDTSTSYAISVGDSFYGTLDYLGFDSNGEQIFDIDFIAISLTAGESIQIEMTGVGGDNVEVFDPVAGILDSSGSILGFHDDIDFDGGNYDVSFAYTATYTGIHYLVADGYDDGTYVLTVSESSGGGDTGGGDTGGGNTGGTGSNAPEGTLDELAEYLENGYWQDSFNTTVGTFVSNTITVNITSLTAEGQQLARWAFEAWEMVAGITFVEVTGTANMDFSDDQSGAFAGPNNTNGTTYTSASVNVSESWIGLYGSTIDSYTFGTYIHEIGHALGLGHQGFYNGGATFSQDATFSNDSYQVSVMSYFGQDDNPNVDADYGDPITAMLADIVAIQNMYGGPSATNSATAGDTTFGANGTTGTYLDLAFDPNSPASAMAGGNPIAGTLYDVGGIDTIDLSTYTFDQVLNLNDESISSINGANGNLGIARGTIIENAITGDGNDTIVGNEAANTITAGGGRDNVNGNAGSDIINGGDGNDTLNGGGGFDTINGGAGNDRIDGGNNSDQLFGNTGNDTITGGEGADRLEGGTGNDRLDSGSGADRAEGDDGNDLIFLGSNFGGSKDGGNGGIGDDTIYGEGGFDILLGGEGADSLIGGNQADNLFGNDGDDVLDGGNGKDRLFGNNGNDTINGGDGDDLFSGGFGNDEINGEGGGDNIYAGEGNDVIDGGIGDDHMRGQAGNDTLIGGEGGDTLTGGSGEDVFVFADGHGNDTITDYFLGGANEYIDFSGITGLTYTDLQVGSDTSGAAIQSGNDVIITTSTGNTVTLSGVDLSNMDIGDFLF